MFARFVGEDHPPASAAAAATTRTSPSSAATAPRLGRRVGVLAVLLIFSVPRLRIVLAKTFDVFTDGANHVLAQPKLFEDQVPQLDLHVDQNAGQTVVFMAV
jgi:hypothetical protein